MHKGPGCLHCHQIKARQDCREECTFRSVEDQRPIYKRIEGQHHQTFGAAPTSARSGQTANTRDTTRMENISAASSSASSASLLPLLPRLLLLRPLLLLLPLLRLLLLLPEKGTDRFEIACRRDTTSKTRRDGRDATEAPASVG